MATGFLQALDDMVRLAANGVTFGGADRLASALGERNTAAKTAAAAERAGLAGDVAGVLGIGGGAKLLWQGAKQVPRVARAALSKKGAAATGLGAGALLSYNNRTQPQARAAAQPAAPAKAAAKPSRGSGTQRSDRIADEFLSSIKALDSQPPTFNNIVDQVAAANGGNISLRELMAISEVAQRATPKAGKTPPPGDMAGRMLENQYITQFEKALADPNVDPVAAQQEFEEKILQLRKTQFIDPYGLQQSGIED